MTSKIPGKQLGMSIDGWVKVSGSVSPSTTNIVDIQALADMQGLRYMLCYWNDANDKRRLLDISVVKKTGSLKDIVYGKIGDSLDVAVDFGISGSDLQMSITNNEAFPVDFQLARLILT